MEKNQSYETFYRDLNINNLKKQKKEIANKIVFFNKKEKNREIKSVVIQH